LSLALALNNICSNSHANFSKPRKTTYCVISPPPSRLRRSVSFHIEISRFIFEVSFSLAMSFGIIYNVIKRIKKTFYKKSGSKKKIKQ